MKGRGLALPGGCWKLQTSVSTRQREAPMEAGYDGRQVAGMDLHRRRSVRVRMTGEGQDLGSARITSSPGGQPPEPPLRRGGATLRSR